VVNVRNRLFGWLHALLGSSASERLALRAFAFVSAAAGVVLLGWFVLRLSSRLAPIERPLTIESVDSACDKLLTGGSYWIEVDGRRHSCTGSDSWCPSRTPVMVVYDRVDPARCRAAANVGKPSRWEISALLAFSALVAFGISLLLIREHETSRVRDWLGHGLFVLWLGLVAVMLLFGFSPLD
jgi:hypothetical protein